MAEIYGVLIESEPACCSKNLLARDKKAVRPSPGSGPFGLQRCCVVDLLFSKSTKFEIIVATQQLGVIQWTDTPQ
jgi:hypothetical protein